MSDILKLLAGVCYRTRDGQKVGPLVVGGSLEYPFLVENDVGSWTANGRFSAFGAEHSYDLVAEWIDVPDTTSPVRTVEHTEIVPGTYGRLLVDSVNFKRLSVDIDLTSVAFTAAECRATAAMLTAIANGLDRIASERNSK